MFQKCQGVISLSVCACLFALNAIHAGDGDESHMKAAGVEYFFHLRTDEPDSGEGMRTRHFMAMLQPQSQKEDRHGSYNLTSDGLVQSAHSSTSLVSPSKTCKTIVV